VVIPKLAKKWFLFFFWSLGTVSGFVRAHYFTDYPTLIIMDSLLRAMIEQDPKTSMSKFVKYNVPKFLESLTKNRKVRASR
jgi:hypothetical protein